MVMDPAGIIEPMEISSSPAIISSPIGNATIPSEAATLSQLAAPFGDRKLAPPKTAKKTKTVTRPRNEPVSGLRRRLPSAGCWLCLIMKTLWSQGSAFPESAAAVPKTRDGLCQALGERLGGQQHDVRSAIAGLRSAKGRIDVGRVNNARPGQDCRRRGLEPVVDKPVRERDRQETLQPRLLVDREQLRASLNAVQRGLVHIERAELDLVVETGLLDAVGGAICVESRNRDHPINRGVLQKSCLDGLGDGGRVAEAAGGKRQLG